MNCRASGLLEKQIPMVTMKSRLQPRIIGAVASAIGLAGTLTLGICSAVSDRAPIWSNPIFWFWVTSPYLVWGLVCYYARMKYNPMLVVVLGSIVSNIGGLLILGLDAIRARTPGGMNPFSTSNIAITMVAVAFLQWVLFGLTLVGAIGSHFCSGVSTEHRKD